MSEECFLGVRMEDIGWFPVFRFDVLDELVEWGGEYLVIFGRERCTIGWRESCYSICSFFLFGETGRVQ